MWLIGHIWCRPEACVSKLYGTAHIPGNSTRGLHYNMLESETHCFQCHQTKPDINILFAVCWVLDKCGRSICICLEQPEKSSARIQDQNVQKVQLQIYCNDSINQSYTFPKALLFPVSVIPGRSIFLVRFKYAGIFGCLP